MLKRLLAAATIALCATATAAPAPQGASLKVGSRTVTATYVRAPLEHYQVTVALAGGRVGGNATLLDIATRGLASCAINGTFLAAYTGQSGEPYGTIAAGGRFLHLGSTGTRLDVLPDGSLRFVRDKLRVLGAMDGHWAYPDNWYAYGLNQTPSGRSNYSYVFTPERGGSLGFRPGFAATVVNGIVTSTASGRDVPIPRAGFVVALGGSEAAQLSKRFTVGRRAEYRVVDAAGTILDQEPDGPRLVQYSLGAGPRLLSGGAVAVDAAAEGFTQAKILSERGARSAVGVTRAGEVVLAVFPSATLHEAAAVLRSLGAIDGMNLDGGASSGLVCGGKYVVRPGRLIANALVVRPRL